MLQAIPLMSVPALIYAIFAFANGASIKEGLAARAFVIPTASGQPWEATWGGVLLIFSVLLLFIEILKSTQPSKLGMLDNSLSIVVFIACMVLFLLVPGFATTEFVLIMLMALMDFLAGSIVMLMTAQRTVQFDNNN
jgi:hypothetical protein